jgi:hypothetical protein
LADTLNISLRALMRIYALLLLRRRRHASMRFGDGTRFSVRALATLTRDFAARREAAFAAQRVSDYAMPRTGDTDALLPAAATRTLRYAMIALRVMSAP